MLEKITEATVSQKKRSYEDACAAAHALDLVGERWALLVIRELMLGPRRFSDLRNGLPGISANVLTQRLDGLEQHGIVRRRTLPPPTAAQVYELTPWGYESEPIFQALGRWAARSPHHDPTLAFSTASLVLSLRTMWNSARAAGLDATIGFVVGNETLCARISNASLSVEHGPAEPSDVVFKGTAPVIAAAIYGGQPIETLEDAGVLMVSGDRDLAARFITLFPLPSKAVGAP
jgi:DNA-binding HxlR family transcriptional regulator